MLQTNVVDLFNFDVHFPILKEIRTYLAVNISGRMVWAFQRAIVG